VDALARKCGSTGANWYHQCHAASIAIVKAQLEGDEGARVARGTAWGVGGQHSWVVFGDPYDPTAPILDPTLWSYNSSVKGLFELPQGGGDRYRPHGSGSIWNWGQPRTRADTGESELILLTPKTPLSDEAKRFIEHADPDRHGFGTIGWMDWANSPVGGWPSKEIFQAMYDTKAVRPLIPIDILGMLTDINPGGLYLPGEEKSA
ncbi:MAG: hypothetical protein ABWX92_07135, partial [Mycetocola sp.]